MGKGQNLFASLFSFIFLLFVTFFFFFTIIILNKSLGTLSPLTSPSRSAGRRFIASQNAAREKGQVNLL